MSARCLNCRSTFEPSRYQNRFKSAAGEDARRVPALYCSNACKQAAYRKRVEGRPETPTGRCETACSVSDLDVAAPALRRSVTRALTTPSQAHEIRAPKPVAVERRYPGNVLVVPDDTYAGMYRVRHPDGTLTDMTNRARAWDAARPLSDAIAVAKRKLAA